MSAPNAWIDLIGQLRLAQVARRAMRDISVGQPIRDAATVEYSRAMDAIFGRLDQMMELGLTGRISELLAKRGRV
ncbi:MAG: hypothetical protein JWS10_965 [Cypionkella sp.]|uniref:hypothetical protein n=1 Tax=Cypionkella sp. TaxID=2811411 RepID=UPI002607E24A|nr:hypothetical protein [Cypionkella sp.]MDB5658350.1 hypothetical protein [Cypionkella sp.]